MTPTYDRWRDDQGTPIPQGCRVEQIGVARDRGALRSRLGKTATVVTRSQKGTRLRVRFDGEAGVVSIQPLLVRVIPQVVTAQQVIAELGAVGCSPASEGTRFAAVTATCSPDGRTR